MPDYTAGKARILLEPTARGFFSKAKASLRTEAGQQKLQQDVLLRPVATRFRADADAQLRAMRGVTYDVNLRPNIANRSVFRGDAKAQAETHLKGLYATMAVRAELTFKYADAQLAAWRTRQEAKPLKIKVITEHVGGVGRPSAGNMIRRDAPILTPDRTMAFGHNVPILGMKTKLDDTEVKQGVEKLKRDIESPGRQPKIKPRLDQNEFDKAWNDAMKAFRPRRLPGPSIRGVELLAPAMLSVASESAPALIAALGGVVGAIEEMSGAALAAPGALAVLGTSIGTLALGVTGIKAAWKALSQEQDRSGNQATADADKFAHSQEQMSHALSDQKRSQEDLTKARKDARRELEDLHTEERSSYLSVAEAALDLQKARNELAAPSQGPLDRDEKILRELRAREQLSEAIRKQGRARQDVNEADQKGIEGSDRVQAAQEALVRSNQQVADTLKQIQEGSAGAAGAADKVKAAMADLSPNAAELTRTLFDLRESALKPLGRVVSQNMFAGMAGGIKSLVNADLPLLTTGFGRVASALNRNFGAVIGGLNTAQNRGVLNRIFGNTEEFHKRITAAIAPAIRALGTLAAAGSNTMPRLATQFAHMTDRFSNWIDKADKEGRLDNWINKGITATESLGRSLGNIFRTLDSIGRAFGGGLTTSIEHVTKRMADFFASGKGQNALLSVIQLVHQELDDWRPLLQDLPTIFGAMMTGIRGSMGTLLPVLNFITSTLRMFPGLASSAVGAFITWRAFTPILAAMSAGLIGISSGLGRLPGVARGAKASMKTVSDEAAMMSTGFVNVGRKATAAEKESGGAMTRLGGTIRSGATSAVRGLSSALSSTAAFMTGPWGAAVTIAISFLAQLIEKSHDAADAADAQRQAEERLAGSLEQVTNAAGESTRSSLALELEKYQPQQGLQGNVRQAAEARGVDRDRLMRALLPGGAGEAGNIYQDIRKDLRGPIIEAAGQGVVNTLRGQGFTDDNLVDAYLGDKDQLARLREIMDRPQMKLPPQAGGLMGFNLTDVTGKLNQQQQGGALVTQYLSSRIPALQSAQQQAQQAQRTATGGVPTMTATGGQIFGPSARPSFDGTTAKVEVDGNFEATNKEQAENMKARGDTFHWDAFRNVTTVTLGTDDQSQIVNIPTPASRESGGPSPEVGMRGPTGGVISELHPSEWVLPKHARERLGDDWLWDQTKNKAQGGRSHSYEWGGPVLPPLAPGPAVPPVPTPPPIPPPPVSAPAPASSSWAGATVPNVEGAPPALPGPPPAPSGPTGGPIAPDAVGAGAAIPPNATPQEQANINGPGLPTVDPATGQLTSPGGSTPNFGDQMANAFLSPWGFQKDPSTGQVTGMGGGGSAAGTTDPGTYLGKWAANFGMSLGSELISGIGAFFGINTDNVYFQAFKKTLGFYSDKIGAPGQNVDPSTQQIVGSNIAGYTSLVDPSTGTTYLVPNDSAGGAAAGATGGGPIDLGALASMPPGKAPEAGLQPNAIKANRALSAAFPQIAQIGGVRDDPLKWHPGGLALDVMIPGGDTHNGKNPQGKALGDQMWAWMAQHAGELGIDMNSSLWQTDQGGNHYTHIHLAVFGKNNPGPGATDGSPGSPAAAPPESWIGAGGAAPGAPSTSGPPPLRVPGATRPGAGRGGPLSGIDSNSLFGGGGNKSPFAGARGRGKIVVLPRGGGGLSGRVGHGGAFAGEPPHDRASVAKYIYNAAISRGYNSHEALAIVAYSQGESGLNPEISGGAQGAGGSKGGNDDVVIGLFQEKPGFARAGGVDPASRYTVSGNVTAYLNQLVKHRGSGDIYDQLLATSVGGPMYTGGRGAMTGLEAQVQGLLGGNAFHYQYGGLLPQGVTVMHHEDPKPDVVVPYEQAAATVAALKASQAPPDQGATAQHMVPPAPPPPPEVNIPQALPPPGPQAQPMPMLTPPPPAPAAAPAGATPDPNKSYEHPGLKQGVTSGFSTAGNLAAMAASAMGGMGGAAGPLIAGLFQQGGKIANDAINVGAAFASGFLHFGGTTENPYGVQQTRKDAPPGLGADNRRVHMGNNYFASMDEWRRRTQLQDAQDMQGGMARIR